MLTETASIHKKDKSAMGLHDWHHVENKNTDQNKQTMKKSSGH